MTATPPKPPAGSGFTSLFDRVLALVLNKSHRPSPGGQEYWKRAIDAQHGWPKSPAAPPTPAPPAPSAPAAAPPAP